MRKIKSQPYVATASHVALTVKTPPASAGDRGMFHPWAGKFPWRKAWQATPIFLLENPMDRRAWQAHRIASSQT